MGRLNKMTTFRPVQGKGFAWGIGFMVFTGACVATPIVISVTGKNQAPALTVTLGLLLVAITAMFGYFSWAVKNMEYVLDNDKLVINWAFNHKKIPFDSITGFQRIVGTSSFKVVGASWPGFHLGSFSNPAGKGMVNMYGTRIWGEMLLLRTKWEVIGITPENVDEFLDELNKNVPGLKADVSEPVNSAESYSALKDKKIWLINAVTIAVFVAAGVYLVSTIPTLPAKIPMQYNLAGEVSRLGSPKEIYTVWGIGMAIELFMLIMTGLVARNNRTSARMMAIVGLFLAVIFSMISIGMVLSS
jgi:hypothetical protein